MQNYLYCTILTFFHLNILTLFPSELKVVFFSSQNLDFFLTIVSLKVRIWSLYFRNASLYHNLGILLKCKFISHNLDFPHHKCKFVSPLGYLILSQNCLYYIIWTFFMQLCWYLNILTLFYTFFFFFYLRIFFSQLWLSSHIYHIFSNI